MKNIKETFDKLQEQDHDAWKLFDAALEISNSPEFIATAARLLLKAAEADAQEHYRIVKSLEKELDPFTPDPEYLRQMLGE